MREGETEGRGMGMGLALVTCVAQRADGGAPLRGGTRFKERWIILRDAEQIMFLSCNFFRSEEERERDHMKG